MKDEWKKGASRIVDLAVICGLWFGSVVVIGTLCKVTYLIFMLGWGLL
jgi:hypothetical protein